MAEDGASRLGLTFKWLGGLFGPSAYVPDSEPRYGAEKYDPKVEPATRLSIAMNYLDLARQPDMAPLDRERALGMAALYGAAGVWRGVSRAAGGLASAARVWLDNSDPGGWLAHQLEDENTVALWGHRALPYVQYISPPSAAEKARGAALIEKARPEQGLSPASLSALRLQDPERALAADRRARRIYAVSAFSRDAPLEDQVQFAGAATGVDADFLGTLVQRESMGKADAQASTSSARGLTQVIDSTWLHVMRAHGPDYGLDPDLSDDQIIALKTDPIWSLIVGAEYTKENAAAFRSQNGRSPTQAEAYLMHHFGAQTGMRMARGAEIGVEDARTLAPDDAIAANHSVFYDAQNRPRSALGLELFLTRSFANAPLKIDGPDP